MYYVSSVLHMQCRLKRGAEGALYPLNLWVKKVEQKEKYTIYYNQPHWIWNPNDASATL